jgi:hypothetical protein
MNLWSLPAYALDQTDRASVMPVATRPRVVQIANLFGLTSFQASSM